jgi:hypothetical protein
MTLRSGSGDIAPLADDRTVFLDVVEIPDLPEHAGVRAASLANVCGLQDADGYRDPLTNDHTAEEASPR